MVNKRRLLNYVNKIALPLNTEVKTLTASREESKRLSKYYDSLPKSEPVFPVSGAFIDVDFEKWLIGISEYKARFESFVDRSKNDVGYCLDNDYFTSPDTEILYTIISKINPKCFLEVGSGNSTRIVRQAILDNDLRTKIVSVDPMPRVDVESFCDESLREKAENLPPEWFSEKLDVGDVLFIDSSHHVKTGSDVVFLLLRVLPLLKDGVFIHIHDIFLPYEYPRQWIFENGWNWNEQYLVQALLMGQYFRRVLWAAQYAYQTLEDFENYFGYVTRPLRAQSLWLET